MNTLLPLYCDERVQVQWWVRVVEGGTLRWSAGRPRRATLHLCRIMNTLLPLLLR
jgi:hypothetical protein